MCISLQEYDRTAPNQNILKQRQTSGNCIILRYDFRMVLLACINFPWQAFFCSQVRSAPSLKSPRTGLDMADLAAAEPLKIHLLPDTLARSKRSPTPFRSFGRGRGHGWGRGRGRGRGRGGRGRGFGGNNLGNTITAGAIGFGAGFLGSQLANGIFG